MKTRLQKVMEAHGVTKTDIIRNLNTEFCGVTYDFVDELVKEDDLIDYSVRTIKCLAETCNCSTDYLLGLSDVMNPVGN